MKKRRKNPEIEGMPVGGIWYYVYLRPNWFLFSEKNEREQHMLYWPSKIALVLGVHYSLSEVERRKLVPLYASMPRGRITSVGYNISEGVYLAHGGDFPKPLGSRRSQIGEIIREFHLQKLNAAGKVEVLIHEHEEMLADHKKRIQKIIGKVPY